MSGAQIYPLTGKQHVSRYHDKGIIGWCGQILEEL
jgi:hypothetical protein